eukprot:scpid80111/ scgid30320/ Focal adhesion kinase 1; Focal adhesion kinase-related nonkinase; Protein phosphatase 1 regulatory subunit 71; Protein-tyrosine kinase 2; p125FAK; pp125FAK
MSISSTGAATQKAQSDRCRVAVCLNNGATVQILCSRSILMSDLASRVWAQVGQMGTTNNRLLSRHFAFLLESVVSKQEFKYWLPNTMTLAEAEERYMTYVGCPVSAWRYRLKLRYFPDCYKEVVEGNEVFANYFFSQLREEVHLSVVLTVDTALKLAGFEARRLLAAHSQGMFKKSRIESLIRELGIEFFFPKRILKAVKSKQLKKSLLQQIKTLESLTQEECVLNYISLCYHHGNICRQEFSCSRDGTPVTMTICPTRGLVFHSTFAPEHLTPSLPFCVLKEVSLTVTQDSKSIVNICIYHKDDLVHLEFSSICTAFDMVSLIDGYCQCFCKTPVGSLFVSALFPGADEPMLKAGAVPGMPKIAFAPCDSRTGDTSDPDTVLFAREPDYTVPTAGSPEPSRQRSRSKRQIRRLTSIGSSMSASSGDSSAVCGGAGGAGSNVRQRSSPSSKPKNLQRSESHLSTDSVSDRNTINFSLIDGADDVPTLSADLLVLSCGIGEGRFGQVRLGTMISDKKQVAVKTCKSTCAPIEKQKFISEAVIMNQFDHPHIIKMIGVMALEPYAIVMEYASLGELRGYLVSDPPSTLVLLKFCDQLSTAMAYLEKLGFVHRDIAARNVLVCDAETVKLGDFGLSRWVADDLYYKASSGVLPIKWMAPESISFRRFTVASDVWMFGVCMWEIMSFGAKPFTGVKNVDVLTRLEDNERLLQPKDCPDDLYRLWGWCWAFESSDRPTFTEIREEVGKVFLAEGGSALTPQVERLPTKQSASVMQPRLCNSSAQLMAQLSRCASTSKLPDVTAAPFSRDGSTMHERPHQHTTATPVPSSAAAGASAGVSATAGYSRPQLALPPGAGGLAEKVSAPPSSPIAVHSCPVPSAIDDRPPACLPQDVNCQARSTAAAAAANR